MDVHLNGKIVTTGSLTLKDLIEQSGFNSESLIAELNFEVIRQDQWANTRINEGDRIELLSFVGGG